MNKILSLPFLKLSKTILLNYCGLYRNWILACFCHYLSHSLHNSPTDLSTHLSDTLRPFLSQSPSLRKVLLWGRFLPLLRAVTLTSHSGLIGNVTLFQIATSLHTHSLKLPLQPQTLLYFLHNSYCYWNIFICAYTHIFYICVYTYTHII